MHIHPSVRSCRVGPDQSNNQTNKQISASKQSNSAGVSFSTARLSLALALALAQARFIKPVHICMYVRYFLASNDNDNDNDNNNDNDNDLRFQIRSDQVRSV